jgi:hypothetical protein
LRGEEFLVLAGVFQDEHGDYPVGTYVRNPPTSSHTPGSASGCTILVKLWQFDPDDRTQITLNTTNQTYIPDAMRPGVTILPLFADDREIVQLEQWAADTTIDLVAAAGLEIFVLQGDFWESDALFQADSWLRLPSGAKLSARSGQAGCKIWLKQLQF